MVNIVLIPAEPEEEFPESTSWRVLVAVAIDCREIVATGASKLLECADADAVREKAAVDWAGETANDNDEVSTAEVAMEGDGVVPAETVKESK
jgi:hypothetical protein